MFYSMVDPNKPIYVVANATFTLGSVVDVNSKTTRNGCDILDLATSSWGWVIDTAAGSTVNLYSCRLATLGKNGYIILASAGNVWNCTFDYRVSLLLGAGSTISVFNLLALGGQTGIQSRSASATINKITALGTNYACSFRYMDGGSAAIVNVFARNTLTTTVELVEITNTNCYVVDADAGTANWTLTYSGTVTGTVVFRQYSFDLKVTDKDNNPINGATVVLKDKDSNQIFNVNTDANGNIATQTVSRGYYDQPHGNTLQDYGPHTLIITKAGYQTYIKKFTLSAKTAWEIKLAKAQHILLNSGRPVLNLKPSDPENKNVVVL
jgi:hypothetical protein